jgi:Cu(I)/Ag(I) efflux system periplasmic protein CusF
VANVQTTDLSRIGLRIAQVDEMLSAINHRRLNALLLIQKEFYMKTVISAAAIVLLAITNTPALAESSQSGMHQGMNHKAGMAMGKMSNGKVKKLDAAAGKITIAHGPLENLGMPAMTMAFAVKDKAMLKGVKPGDKVNFVAADVGGTLSITSLELAK